MHFPGLISYNIVSGQVIGVGPKSNIPGYAHGSQQKKMTLTATEFLRRFFLHVLPKGFVRIRSFGFLAHRWRSPMLALARQLLGPAPVTEFIARGKRHSLD